MTYLGFVSDSFDVEKGEVFRPNKVMNSSSQFSFNHLENSTHAEFLKGSLLYVQDHNTLKYRKTKGKKIVFIQMMTVQLVNDLTVHKKVRSNLNKYFLDMT